MLHHEVLGQGKPVLFLHGITVDHRHMIDSFEPAFEGLEGWKRIYVDLPGHGQSPPQDRIVSQDGILEVVESFVGEYLDGSTFALVGLSRGSYIARGIMHRLPEQVAGVALIVPGGNPSSTNSLPKHQVIEPDPTVQNELLGDETWAFENFLVVQSSDILAKWRKILKPAMQVHDHAQETRVKQAFDFSFAREEEKTVFEKPALIAVGRQDSWSGYLDAIDLMHRYPRATLAVLDSAGHMLDLERPYLFTALVRDWLLRLSVNWSE